MLILSVGSFTHGMGRLLGRATNHEVSTPGGGGISSSRMSQDSHFNPVLNLSDSDSIII